MLKFQAARLLQNAGPSRSFRGLLSVFVVSYFQLCFPWAGGQGESARELDLSLDRKSALELALKIDELVRDRFYDKSAVEKTWNPAFAAARETILKQSTLTDFAEKMNSLLSLLHASHTQVLTENDETFYFMRSLFSSLHRERQNKSIEADFTGLGVGGVGAKFNQVRYVLDGSPAFVAGFKRGDTICSVNSRPYTGYSVWHGLSGQSVRCVLERQGKRLELMVVPKKEDFLESYVLATQKSARVVVRSGRRLGYVHLWSGGIGSSEALESAILETLNDTEGLVLDLRDGYGGASLDDLDLFFRPRKAFPDMHSRDRKGTHISHSVCDKPLAVLINKGTRSGKELMAYGLKRSKRGRLFGNRTAGYVLGGQFNQINEKLVLYLATVDIKLDGIRLEGKGVEPDVFVADPLSPQDFVLEKALESLVSATVGRPGRTK